MTTPIGIGILLLLNPLFIIMIVFGFIRFKKPESGWLLIAGCIGLAIAVFCTELSSYELSEFVRLGILSYDSYTTLRFFLISVSLMPVIIMLMLLIIGFLYNSHHYSDAFKLIGFLGAIFAFLALGATSSLIDQGKPAEAEVRSNIHAIQIALERYKLDHNGLYPESADTLFYDYLTAFPENPFTFNQQINVSYGSPDFEGNFTYLPVTVDGEIRGYYLIGYGYKNTPGDHLIDLNVDDHVIIVAESGDMAPSGPLPSVQDVIRQSQSGE
jgi:hypothetical protein